MARGIAGLSARAKNSMANLYSLLERVRKNVAFDTPSDLLQEIVSSTEYLKLLERDHSVEASMRVENIQEFFGVLKEFEERQNGGGGALPQFLDLISLETNVDSLDETAGVLSLMTIHTAKGLEFDHVFIVGMEEDIFPHINVVNSGSREIEEERRLCYVAMTRARKQLMLSYAQMRRLYGNRMYNLPSRFLNEVPPHLVQAVNNYSKPKRQKPRFSDTTYEWDEEGIFSKDTDVIEW